MKMTIKKNKISKSTKKEGKNYIKFCPKCNSIDIHQDKSTMQSLGYLPTKYICSNCGYSSFNFPEIEVNELDKLHLQKKQETKESKNKSELIDTSYGKFYVRVMWRIIGPVFAIVGLIYLYLNLHSIEGRNVEISVDLVMIILGLTMIYISFIKLNKHK